MKVSGSSALVTGGASGLGLATAEKLSAAGAQVVIVDLPGSPGADVAERSEGITFVPADVRDSEQISAAIETASSLAPLRITINCAGIGDPAKTLGRRGPLALDRFERVISINLLGTFNVIRLAAEAIAATDPVEGERGVIVNTASVAAFDGQVGQASYSASKAAIAGMTLPVARDLAESLIRVVTIAPGMFATPILQGLTDDARASLEEQIPHPSRLGRPTEYADLVAHIVDNPMLNGETIRLDGALRMAPR
ncbi:SDR family NAD(P)-dependent oxidoreductase [Gordonia terrae]|uniref:KR domain-containing protein n=2 Tax=Gordonia terrae TaxID=2055 RepID=A0AAD0K8X7_9ACTN|nr:SDR family NAD(P)-dependent oxidoreductase [Gordonia terrae]VTR10821.1 3-oxoacyl-ACP reductase [Clostridioides difficile]ANY24383.1 3-hydroxy-2-methylbutyryl-CoA dehydrogenase [Gordonia terrae]AWO85130.1 KR domain-containing protein [Gordonia terrae]VTS58719.1 3-oxoacyl-[acyl-carrier-protein] reductase FabG [Gordonia terrae]GAB46761.1 putative 3-hydroxyacyl-CoA dehydrogenase [Gordonia terrae NBRC 100016]